MSLFEIWITQGIKHILDPQAYDHILYIIALSLPLIHREQRLLLIHVTAFTIGHSLALLLTTYFSFSFPKILIEFLILFSIIISSIFNLSQLKIRSSLPWLINLSIGLVHGVGFGNYFKLFMPLQLEDVAWSLIAFNLGVEIGQCIIIFLLFVVINLLIFAKISPAQYIKWISLGVLGVSMYLCIKLIVL